MFEEAELKKLKGQMTRKAGHLPDQQRNAAWMRMAAEYVIKKHAVLSRLKPAPRKQLIEFVHEITYGKAGEALERHAKTTSIEKLAKHPVAFGFHLARENAKELLERNGIPGRHVQELLAWCVKIWQELKKLD